MSGGSGEGRRVPAYILAWTFLRSFLIQGSWNYHTMLGNGLAYALLPGLRRIHRDDPEAYREAVSRHQEHFNAHPYLAGIALGAVLRLERDGAPPELIGRLKTAVRGPLGSLGDQLVWAGVLPLVALVALVAFWGGAGAAWVVAGFLVLYNAAHLTLRVWGLLAGFESGTEVARTLSGAALGTKAARLGPALALGVGLLCGVLLARPSGLVASGWGWAALAAVAFVVGLKGGHRAWRPAAVATVAAVAVVSLLGGIR